MSVNNILDVFADDIEQHDFIQCGDKRIIVTAPAGCGKTTSMIGKIAYELVNHRVQPHKKILAMSFSVNASLHIREALKDILPKYVDNSKKYINRVDVANYHSFAMKLLKRHGYSLNPEFQEVYSFDITDDNDVKLHRLLSRSHQGIIENFNKKLSKAELTLEDIDAYWNIVNHSLISNHLITFNGMLVSAIQLLKKEVIREFYQQYYSIVMIDEFQDTNMLGYLLIRQLFAANQIIFLGDDVQKIYSFLGAINDIFGLVSDSDPVQNFVFKHNYRFEKNEGMRNLDTLLRGYAEDYDWCNVDAMVLAKELKSDESETNFIVRGVKRISEKTNKTVAILVGSGWQGEGIANALSEEGIPYFNALFGDTDKEQNDFYKVAEKEFYSNIDGRATKSDLNKWLNAISYRKMDHSNNNGKQHVFDSLLKLLKTLCTESLTWKLTTQERYEEIASVLSNRGLRHMMDRLDERVIISTIHSSKGLEWDYVIIPGNNQFVFPNSHCCTPCRASNSQSEGFGYCDFCFTSDMKTKFTEQLNVFYVAVTRAKENVFLTYNTGPNRFNYPKRKNCLLALHGINLTDFIWSDVIE